MKPRSKLLSLIAVLATLSLIFPATFVAAANPPEPTYGAAVVDGEYGEWDLANDFFADMYRAAAPDKEILAKLYLRYECSTATLYALVLVEPGHPVDADISPENHYIKLGNDTLLVDGNAGQDGTPPDFAWVGLSADGTTANGWEASVTLTPDLYTNLNVHTDVDDEETAAVANRAIELLLFCAPPPTAVDLLSFEAAVQNSRVYLTWEMASELNNLGFNVYRAESAEGARTRLNEGLIPSQAPGSVVGTSYEFVDDSALPGSTYYYWLEDVDISGATTLHGPVSAEVTFTLRRLMPARPRPAPSTSVLRGR